MSHTKTTHGRVRVVVDQITPNLLVRWGIVVYKQVSSTWLGPERLFGCRITDFPLYGLTKGLTDVCEYVNDPGSRFGTNKVDRP